MQSQEIIAWATVGLGVATLGAVIVGVLQVKITKGALSAALIESREAVKSRIDQRAAVVTFVAGSALGLATQWLASVPSGQQPGVMGDHTASLFGIFEIANHGPGGAVVKLPKGTLFVNRKDSPGLQPVFSMERLKDLATIRPEAMTITLAPGQDGFLYVEALRPQQEWLSLGGDTLTWTRIEIVVEDSYQDGVRDRTELIFAGSPLFRDDDHGMLYWGPRPRSAAFAIHVNPTSREYKSIDVPAVINSANTVRGRLRAWARTMHH